MRGRAMNAAQTARNGGGRRSRRLAAANARLLLPQRDEVEHHVSTAAPWTSWTSRVGEKSASSRPITSALTIIPASSMT